MMVNGSRFISGMFLYNATATLVLNITNTEPNFTIKIAIVLGGLCLGMLFTKHKEGK